MRGVVKIRSKEELLRVWDDDEAEEEEEEQDRVVCSVVWCRTE